MHAYTCMRHNRRLMSEAFEKPGTHNKAAIRRAGQAMSAGTASAQDEQTVQHWRDCHAYVLNTFQGTLRRWIRNRSYVLVQRLKRLSTVRDKLATGRALDIASMHDLAGCRIIFPSVQDLHGFRNEFHRKTRSTHAYVSAGKFDYLATPKSTGYRGIHDVFKYHVTRSPGSAWNGLRVEIQYRTQMQHAWATAVEISDLIDGERVKFDRGANIGRERLFMLASEYMARLENMHGCLPQLEATALVQELFELEERIGVLARLRALGAGRIAVPNKKNLVLCFSGGQLRIYPFASVRQAMTARNQIELEQADADVVYVRANKPSEVAGAFRNYFRDAREFIDLLPPWPQ